VYGRDELLKLVGKGEFGRAGLNGSENRRRDSRRRVIGGWSHFGHA
jgi:hypothetical protein